ncbi:glutamate-cysteine ligase family protein [Engelhardtia mirabilis]|uniref:glutamate--cysteine ligase n=1 Tax=Engelhardtia mirabilis TaxID=2528011 RepID=A0A518BHZ5_9BACT|nr:Glutamate--cysteine ligase GshA [Planctomycetes bacterium Pla133]QDV00889.1 Glutamate--cysteine ligase GshA [Planctomycetes bacterium Pla86]
MPTKDPELTITVDEALERAAARAFPEIDESRAGARDVGLEPERFAIEMDAQGRPLRRLPLAGPGGVLEAIDQVAGRDDLIQARDPERVPPTVGLTQGGSLTFEPGAQIEHSTAVHPSASAALDDVRAVVSKLEEVFGPRRVALISLGLDPWFGPGDVPQQLDADRYRSMAAYFDARGPSGPWMMRLSCSLQVNVDLGSRQVRDERWLLGNLLSPALVGIFSTSPERAGEDYFHCRRARVWQTIDPTRTGFPAGLLDGSLEGPERQYAAAALDADVLLFRTEAGHAVTGEPGLRFRDWIERGHPVHGWPTIDDLDYHLTTLFFEVRPRGFFELRGIDALPYCMRPAAVAFVCGLLYDERARGLALERLAPSLAGLDQRWRDSAERGLEIPRLRDEVDFLWRTALDGMERLGPQFMREEHMSDARAFAERFFARTAAPVDELRAAVAVGPAAALRWADGSGCSAAV